MPRGEPSLITARQAIARQARGERVAFVDARPEDHVERSGCRIPGAVSLAPGAALRPRAALPRATAVVVYGDHARSFEPFAVAEQLGLRGVPEVHVLAGGFAAWSELRCATELASAGARAPGEHPRRPGASRPALVSLARP